MNTDIKILIVDDEDNLRTAVKKILQMEGYTVSTAENGTKGISIGSSDDFDVVLIDLKMPDISGMEVLARLRQVKPNTSYYIATAYASYETAVEAIKLGAEGYILKPFTPDELLHDIRKGIEKRRLIIEAEELKREREANLLELAFERSRLNTVIKSITEGVLVVNKDREAVYFNPAFIKLLKADELELARNVSDVLPYPIYEMIDNMLNDSSSEIKTQSDEFKTDADGDLYVEVSVSPILGNDHSMDGVVLVVNNITTYKQIELLKNQFISMVSHELKAPVAATLGFLEILTNPSITLPESQQIEYLTRASARLKSLIEMVNDLLDISRSELNTVRREIRPVIVQKVIEEVILLFENEAAKRNIAVEIKYEENIPLINVDPNEIERLLTNLISNAIKYNKNDGKVLISVHKSAKYVEISVEDTGIGMKPGEKDKLFNEFYRAKNEFTKTISGTGLGLSIVKRILDYYQGYVNVESEYGKGTRFIIYLPYIDEHNTNQH
ncbi:MAG: response regulator [Ignavibacteriaceae bacterium]|nr:response regulator [Ignavibacteriaceae bacterium]